MFAQLAGLGLSLGGTLLGMNRAEDSANAAAAAASAAADAQEEAYKKAAAKRQAGLAQSLGFLSPFMQAGQGGQKLLSDALGINGPEAQRGYFANFQNDPGFAAVQGAGIDTVNQSKAASGGLRSGATMKALMDFGQRLQQNVFQDRMTRLADVGKMGATTAGNMATVNEGAHKDFANYEIGEGNAKAGGLINASNAQQMGTQNYLQMLGYGMGQAKGGMNDLFSAFGKTIGGGTGAGWTSGIPSGVGLGGYGGSW